MLRVSKVERIGSGIKRIKDAMKDYGLNVRFLSTGFFTVIFKRPTDLQKTVEKTVEKTREKTVEKIISAIKENPSVSIKQLRAITGLSRRGVEWNITKLKEEGRIKRVGPDKGGYWEIVR